MFAVSGDDIEGMELIPPHANKSKLSPRRRSRLLRLVWTYPLRARIDAYRVLVRIDLHGLQTCGGGCGTLPFGRCEHHEVEHRLGWPVDARHPDDLAIAYALRREAEFRDDAGVDYGQRIREAAQDGRIGP